MATQALNALKFWTIPELKCSTIPARLGSARLAQPHPHGRSEGAESSTIDAKLMKQSAD